jgi:hypothetical protein
MRSNACRALDVGVDRGRPPAREVAELRVGESGAQARGGHDTEDVVDVHALTGTLHDDDAVAFRGGDERGGLGHRRRRGEDERRVPRHGLLFDPADRGIDVLQRHVLRQHAEPAATCECAARRGPVTEFMLDATSGIVAVEPSPGERSTSRRLVIADRRGTRKTSE